MNERTFSRQAFVESQAQWEAGEFSWEWHLVRRRAAERGFIYPPEGSRWDSWEDDNPSQRAILIRAIRETPELLEECIDRSRSWFEVIAKLTQGRDGRREDAELRDRQDAWDRQDEPTPREALVTLKQIVTRIGDS
jgi:hypothetical protein